MKKTITIILIISIFLLTTVAFADEIEKFIKVEHGIKIGNQTVELEHPIYEKNNRLYVPLRNLCENLSIPVKWDDENKEVFLDIYNKPIHVSSKTTYNEEGVIPDEETALAVGKILLEKYAGKSMEYETEDKVYYLTAVYEPSINCWIVEQTYDFKDPNKGWAGNFDVPTIYLSKQTGEVIYINTYSLFEN